MRVIEGHLNARGKKFAIVISRFNELITSKLLAGAMDSLVRHGADESQVSVFWVPGAFELPLVTKKIVLTDRYDAVICLGAVIRGDTPHFDFLAAETTKGIAATGLESRAPVVFGVLTTDTIEQALERSGTKAGNKGWEAALSAIEMIDLYTKIQE